MGRNKNKRRAVVQGVSLFAKKPVKLLPGGNAFVYRNLIYDIRDFDGEKVDLDRSRVDPVGRVQVGKGKKGKKKKQKNKFKKSSIAFLFSNTESCSDVQEIFKQTQPS